MRIAVISDTHGVVLPALIDRLRGFDQIIHAGDVGDEQVLEQLRAIAPLSAVSGNHDWGTPLEQQCPRELVLTLEGCLIYVAHIGQPPAFFRQRFPGARPRVVITGHTHRASLDRYDGILYLNPGSASERKRARLGRPSAPLSMAVLTIVDGEPSAEIVILDGQDD